MQLFQFHKGTIRTRGSINGYAPYYYFNSIKVRLELRLLLDKNKMNMHFNSIKVRLELFSQSTEYR